MHATALPDSSAIDPNTNAPSASNSACRPAAYSAARQIGVPAKYPPASLDQICSTKPWNTWH